MARQGAGRQSCECLVSRASHYSCNVTHDLVVNGKGGGWGTGEIESIAECSVVYPLDSEGAHA